MDPKSKTNLKYIEIFSVFYMIFLMLCFNQKILFQKVLGSRFSFEFVMLANRNKDCFRVSNLFDRITCIFAHNEFEI